MLDLSMLEFYICRYCGMLNEQINPNKIDTLTDGLPTDRSFDNNQQLDRQISPSVIIEELL